VARALRQSARLTVTFGGMLHAIGNQDPFSGAFDLRTGQCVSDPTASVPVHEVRCRDGAVEVRSRHPAPS
jgi:hypothetical protein